MILDTLKNWKDYKWQDGRFTAAFKFLESIGHGIADGRHDIDGDNVYCMIQAYTTRSREGHEYEAHRNYADIQYLLAGEESILWAPTPSLVVIKPYEPDIEMYAAIPSATDLVLKPGIFCVLFPQDAHAPCLEHGGPVMVRKAVVKVRLG